MPDPQFRNRRRTLEAIHDSAVDAIITINHEGLIETVNPSTEKMFGWTAAELIGRNVKVLMPEPYCSGHDGYLKQYLTTGRAEIIGIGREVVAKKRDGTTFPIHLAVSEVRLDDRVVFAGFVRDLTKYKLMEQQMQKDLERLVEVRSNELREAQAELIRSEKYATLGKVAGGIAHEIRNPLNAVKTSAYYLLNAREPPAAKVTEHLDRIDRQVTIIDNVISALTDVARMPEANLLPVLMEPLIRRVVNTTNLPANVRTVYNWPADLPAVLADEHQIVIAFRNLIRNARDAMPSGGVITISARHEQPMVVFCVADNGVGISEHDLDRILEPLYTTKARGIGLGLSITRAIVDKNRGKLSVTSELEKGSSFCIALHASRT